MFVLFSGVAFFQLCGYMNFQNNGFLMLIDEVPLHNVKIGVWCAVSATRNVGPFHVHIYTYL
jgi:hypothetical protein